MNPSNWLLSSPPPSPTRTSDLDAVLVAQLATFDWAMTDPHYGLLEFAKPSDCASDSVLIAYTEERIKRLNQSIMTRKAN